jgi:hypothetical protein
MVARQNTRSQFLILPKHDRGACECATDPGEEQVAVENVADRQVVRPARTEQAQDNDGGGGVLRETGAFFRALAALDDPNEGQVTGLLESHKMLKWATLLKNHHFSDMMRQGLQEGVSLNDVLKVATVIAKPDSVARGLSQAGKVTYALTRY